MNCEIGYPENLYVKPGEKTKYNFSGKKNALFISASELRGEPVAFVVDTNTHEIKFYPIEAVRIIPIFSEPFTGTS
jgi:hypothetical protein